MPNRVRFASRRAIVSDSSRRRAVESLAREVERRSEEDERRLIEQIGDAVRLADVLLDEEPEIRQRVGRVIDVVDRLPPASSLRAVSSVGGDPIVDALLPVLRARASARRSILVWRRKSRADGSVSYRRPSRRFAPQPLAPRGTLRKRAMRASFFELAYGIR